MPCAGGNIVLHGFKIDKQPYRIAVAVIASCPRHPYTRSLIAASPRFGSHYSRDRLVPIPGKVTDPARPEPGCPFAPRCARARDECAAAIPELKALSGGDSAHIIRCVPGGGE